ncbi:MAG: DUF1287 domain-containing protein [Epsilonproteobacteria bacterium]|nr:MAG: DUF1287 domain-containing protein [Campylobacterota bacterium]
MRKALLLFIVVSIWIFAGTNDTFIKSAQDQVGKTLTYNPEYRYIKYPMGDIPLSKGVCTDVIVRAFRGVDIDLQDRIYKHKKKYPKSYKGLYYTDKLDPNIDHRRVKNIQTYLVARGYRVNDDFKPGDIVVWKLKARNGKSLDHIGICSDKRNAHGEPLIIHNINSGAKEEDVLRSYKIVDHFRVFER